MGSFMNCVHLGSEDPRGTLLRVRGGGEDAGAVVVAGVVEVGARDPATLGEEKRPPGILAAQMDAIHEDPATLGEEAPRRTNVQVL